MPPNSLLNKLDNYWKLSKWKKVVNTYYLDINEETMARFLPLYRGQVLCILAGVTNRRLNRISWDITGVPAQFGTPKQQLTSANMCMLSAANAEIEFDEPEQNYEIGPRIIAFTLENARQFDTIEKIREAILDVPQPARFLDDLVCVELALGDRSSASRLVAQAKAANPLFETTFLGRVERFLAQHAPPGL